MSVLQVVILDVRVPCTPVARLNNHRACVNGIAWAPHSSCHICTAGNSTAGKFENLCLINGCERLVSPRHSGRPPGPDLGHPADAPGHRGPHPGLHGRRGDQQRAVGLHAAGLDRHLLQQLPGDPPCIKTHWDTINPLLRLEDE